MTFTLPQVLVLFCALAAGAFGTLGLLLLSWNRARTELVLYACLAFAIAFWLATPLLTPVPIPVSREILGRLVHALSFVLPAVGFLFLLRFLNLRLTAALMALLALPLAGTLLALALPAASPLVGGLAVVSVGLVSAGFLVVFARKENRRRDTTLAFVATAFLLAGATLETGSRWTSTTAEFSGVFFGFAFLAEVVAGMGQLGAGEFGVVGVDRREVGENPCPVDAFPPERVMREAVDGVPGDLLCQQPPAAGE